MDWAKYGAWGAGGVLLGIGVVVLTEPATSGGVGIILFVCLLSAIVMRGILKALGVIS